MLSSLRGWSSCDLPFISIYNSWSGSLWCGWCLGGGHGRGLDDGLHDGEEQPDRGRGGQAAVVAACIYQSYRPLLPLLHHRLLDDLPRLPDEPDFWFVQQVDLSLRSFPLTLRRSRHFSFLALVFSFSFSYRGGGGEEGFFRHLSKTIPKYFVHKFMGVVSRFFRGCIAIPLVVSGFWRSLLGSSRVPLRLFLFCRQGFFRTFSQIIIERFFSGLFILRRRTERYSWSYFVFSKNGQGFLSVGWEALFLFLAVYVRLFSFVFVLLLELGFL